MGNVVSIRRGELFITYRGTHASGVMREHFVFLSLIAITLVLPVVAYCSHEGPISPVAFAVCATFGVGRGLVMYRRGSNAVNYLMGTGIVPRAPLSNVGLKKAA